MAIRPPHHKTQEIDLSSFPCPIARITQTGRLLSSSRSLNEFLQTCRLKSVLEVLNKTRWNDQGSAEEKLKNQRGSWGYFKFRDSKKTLNWYQVKLTPLPEKHFLVSLDNQTDEKIKHDLAAMAESTALAGSWEVDLLFNQVYWSDTTRLIHEVEKDYVPDLESGINFYKPGYSQDKIRQIISRTIETGDPFDVELQIVTAKGNEKWIRVVGKSDFKGGQCTRFYGTLQDIERRIKNQVKLQRLHERIELAASSAQVGFWDLDIRKKEVYWDDVMYDLHGVKREAFQGDVDAWEKTAHPEDKAKLLEEVEAAIAGIRDFNSVYRIVTPRGDIKYITGKAQVIRNTSNEPIRMIGASTDITRIKRSETRLRSLLEITEKQNQSLVNFAHIVSHNLRSNSSNLSLLTGMVRTGKMPIEKAIEMIQVSADRLEETVMDLNEVVQVKTQSEEQRQILFRKTLLEVIEGINATWENSKAKLILEVESTLRIVGVKSYVESVIHNMLTNALKYAKEEEPLQLRVFAKTEGDNARIYFEDNGQGIDLDKHRDKIFGMYKTFHGNSDAKGIGLFLSQSQMESMGGKITVASKPGRGATFCLHFKREG